jgi:hypothetical protein
MGYSRRFHGDLSVELTEELKKTFELLKLYSEKITSYEGHLNHNNLTCYEDWWINSIYFLIDWLDPSKSENNKVGYYFCWSNLIKADWRMLPILFYIISKFDKNVKGEISWLGEDYTDIGHITILNGEVLLFYYESNDFKKIIYEKKDFEEYVDYIKSRLKGTTYDDEKAIKINVFDLVEKYAGKKQYLEKINEAIEILKRLP